MGKLLYRVDEVMVTLAISRSQVYQLIDSGELVGHNPSQNLKDFRISGESLWNLKNKDLGTENFKGKDYIYFIGSLTVGPIKIGRTTNLGQRLGTLQRMSPLPLGVIWVKEDEGNDEVLLHSKFAMDRLHGEWFAPSNHLIQYINQISSGCEFYGAGNKYINGRIVNA